LTPITARIVADLILGGDSSDLAAAFAPSRALPAQV